MLLVKTEVKPSLVNGLGLFAAEPIKAGALVWKYDSRFDREFYPDQIHALPAMTQELLHHFGYEAPSGAIRMAMDGARYLNHSKAPNLGVEEESNYAIRDIALGEELFEDYTTYESAFRLRNP